MNNKKRELPILEPYFFKRDDPKNPKNINADKLLEDARKKQEEELKNKEIIIDNDNE